MIELEMQELCSDDKHVILTGDFNARTGTSSEFFDIENAKNDQFEEIFDNMKDDLTFLSNKTERNNEDKYQNAYGKMLLEMCKANKMLIVNGRIGDNLSGRLTCKGSSTVDYFLCDYSTYKYVSNMRVLEQSKLFSDIHTPIILYLNLQRNTNAAVSQLKVDCLEKINPWDPTKEKSIDTEHLCKLLLLLDNSCVENTTDVVINDIVDLLNNIYIDATKIAIGSSIIGGKNQISKTRTNSKPWFTKVCQKKLVQNIIEKL